MSGRRLLATLGLLLVVAMPAAAHSRSESHAAWDIDGGSVRVTVTLPAAEALRLVPPGAPAPADAQLGAYLEARISVASRDQPCALARPAQAVASAAGFRRIEMAFACNAPQPMTLRSEAFLDLVPTHVMIARLRYRDAEGETQVVEQLFTADQRRIELRPAAGALAGAGFPDFLALGIEHIVTGIDHVAFLAGLVLISRRRRDLALLVTGFTLGHSLTLGLAVSGLLRPETASIDVLIALTIALVGAEAVVAATRRGAPVAAGAAALLLGMAGLRLAGLGSQPVTILLGGAIFAACYLRLAEHLSDMAPVRALIAVVFGLVHGFAFARDLIELGLPPGRLAALLLGFNLGVEIGQLGLVVLMLAVAALLARLRLAPPRPVVLDLAAPALAGLGVFWIVSRTYG